MTNRRWIQFVLVCLAGLFAAHDAGAEAASRRLEVSDPLPEFSVADIEGHEYRYDPAGRTALLVLFFSPEKPQSLKAAEDIEEVLGSFSELPCKLDLLAVLSDPNSTCRIRVSASDRLAVHVIRDEDFKLWGRFGVVAVPTVFLAGTDGRIELIKAGHGYDFAPAIKAKLEVIMGLASEEEARDVRQVKTATHTSVQGKAHRHLRMAQLLEQKGRYAAAAKQLEAAVGIDPNSVECLLELGRLYAVSDPNSPLKSYPRAEEYLKAAVDLSPENGRAFYELGKLYQCWGQMDKAVEYYRKSLDQVFENRP